MTRIVVGVPPDWGVAVSMDPTVRCSWLAAAAGNAAGTGSPWRGGPGHVPAVSIAWELIPSSDASSICLVAVVVLVASDGSWSIFRPQRALQLETDPRPSLAQGGTDLL